MRKSQAENTTEQWNWIQELHPTEYSVYEQTAIH